MFAWVVVHMCSKREEVRWRMLGVGCVCCGVCVAMAGSRYLLRVVCVSVCGCICGFWRGGAFVASGLSVCV